MDVFVIPMGLDKYELYFEPSQEEEPDAEPPSSGVFGRLRQKFTFMLRAAEERQRRPGKERAQGWLAWAQDRTLGWVAERIAEQRLLWHLRRQTEAAVIHPPDMTLDEALTVVKRMLKGDYDRHRLWLIVDTIGFALSGVFFFVPGPNMIAYFFAFRLVGHWLSMRGAAQGIRRILWIGKPCPPLGALREARSLDPQARRQRVDEVARELRLQRLTAFYVRLSGRYA